MLRQRVLKKWQSCKEKLIKEREFVKFLATQSFEETALPSFPLGIEICRQNLDGWTDPNYQAKLSQHKSDFYHQQDQFGELNETSILLSTSYLEKIGMFNDLVMGWKKEIDNNSSGGPTIEEVDY